MIIADFRTVHTTRLAFVVRTVVHTTLVVRTVVHTALATHDHHGEFSPMKTLYAELHTLVLAAYLPLLLVR